MQLSSSISTTNFSRAYLRRAWETRSTLADYEKNGFAIFFYLTVTGHVEASMVELMERRLMYTRSVVSRHKEGAFSWAGTDSPLFPTRPIHDTLMSVIAHFARRIDKASLDSLIELFQDVFAVQLSETLGDSYLDLKALAGLRNVFAHGREMWLKFVQDEANLLSLDRNPLQLPAQRLLAAGVLSTLEFDSRTHNEFQRAFFSDAAMLYFLGRAREIESKLKDVLAFAPEMQVPLMVALPNLTA